MGEKRPVKGLSTVGVPGRLFTWENRDEASLDFVEGGFQPGSPTRSGGVARPVIRGGQDQNVDFAAVKTGSPGTGKSAGRVAWRLRDAPDWKGYTLENIQSGWDMLDYTVATKHADTTRMPQTGEILLVIAHSNGTTESALRCHVWTPSTNTWAAYSIRAAPPAGYDYADVAVTALDKGRAICIVTMLNDGVDALYEVHQSTDSGKTWSRYEENAILIAEDTPIAGTERGSMAWQREASEVCWVRQYVQQSTGDMRIFQYGSVDFGATYSLVREWVTASSTLPADINLLPLPGGRYMLVYLSLGASLKFRLIGSAFRAFEDAVEWTIPAPVQANSVTAHVDDSGVVHVYAGEYSFNPTGRMFHTKSGDLGRNWTTPHICWNTTSAVDYPERMVSVSSMGQHFVAMQHASDAGSFNARYGVARFGGWSEAEERDLAIPPTGTPANHVLLFNPYELPFNMGTHWTRGGAGGTWTQDLGGNKNGATILTTTGTPDYVSHDYGAVYPDYFVALKGEVMSGGGLGALSLGLEMTSANGAQRFFARITFSTTAFRVAYNEAGFAASVDTPWAFASLGRVHIRVSLDSANSDLDVWYKGNASPEWTRVAGAPFALVPTASGANSLVIFGSTNGTAGVSEWEIGQVGVGLGGKIAIRAGLAQLRGQAISDAYGYPLPGVGPDDLIARLLMKAGPIIVGETFTIDAISTFPIANCYPDHTSKRRRLARTADTGAHIIAAWDVETAFESMYMYVDGNPWRVLLEGTETDWGSPEIIATYDPAVDFTGVAYVREGDSIKADTSGTSGARPLFNQEQMEGWVDLGGGHMFPVRSNTPGEWTTGAHAGIAKARIYLDGATGAAPTAGNCTIYSPRGVVVAHNVKKTYKKYRVSIPAGANPWGYHELRYLSVGYLSCPGLQHARTWGWQRARNSETRPDRARSRYVLRTGTAPRTYSMSWPNGANMLPVRLGSADFIGADIGNPLAVYGLVAGWAMGLPEETDSGARMIVAMPVTPKSGGTLTAPDLFCFGHLDSDISVTNALGQQGVHELERVDTVSIREGV